MKTVAGDILLPMGETNDAALSRRLLYGTILVGILILCNLGLFGVLLFRSLSEKEISRILLETRSEAEQIAQELAGEVERQGSTDLFNALVQEQETQTYIDRVLAQRKIVETVRIFDRSGKLVFENKSQRLESGDDTPALDLADPLAIETTVLHREIPYDVVEVPVGNVGSFVIGISRAELERRAGQLRADLIRSAAPIAVLTLLVLVGAYLFILWLVRRAKKLEGRAKEAEQLAYIGTLASGLAHEIRSPLNSLNLNMQMLEEEAVESDRRSNHRLLAITRAEITRLENLVTDFLSYARPRPLALARARAVDLLLELREVLAGQLRLGSVEIAVDDRTGGAEVEVDRDQMRQLLLNLVQNGVAAAEDAGRRPRVNLTAEYRGSRVVLGVEDNGAGIAPELTERVFDLFYSTRKGGTGLGLAIARRIARAHNGEVELDSTPGEGTRALVSLPASPSRLRHQSAPPLEQGVASSP
jgi:signal transduction histidine kinase